MKTIAVGSSTRTMRAQDILKSHGINTRIRRLDRTGDGCTRGLLVEDGQAARALRLLTESGIPASLLTEGQP